MENEEADSFNAAENLYPISSANEESEGITKDVNDVCENCLEKADFYCQDCQNAYCKMCSAIRHRQHTRNNHCLTRLSKLDMPVASQFDSSHITSSDNLEMELTGLLVKHYKLNTFNDWQLEAIKAVLEGRNCLVVQPTGSGKSICFQIPALFTRKITVVLTPTISLMKDQCLQLEQKGIQATFLGSSQVDKEVDLKITDKCYSIVYVTPEKFFSESGVPSSVFSQLLKGGHIGLIALDEAHLIETWNSFRPAFKHVFPFCQDWIRTHLHIKNLTPIYIGVILRNGTQNYYIYGKPHVNKNHWVCITVNKTKDNVTVYDSLYTNIPLTMVDCVISLLRSSAQFLTLSNVSVQKQTNYSDYGIFAIAIATSLCHGENPTMVKWNISKMRNHLLQCLTNGKLDPFPQAGNYRQPPKVVRSELKFELHCSCRQRHKKNQVMKLCSDCKKWYHKACINITKEELRLKDWRCNQCLT